MTCIIPFVSAQHNNVRKTIRFRVLEYGAKCKEVVGGVPRPPWSAESGAFDGELEQVVGFEARVCDDQALRDINDTECIQGAEYAIDP